MFEKAIFIAVAMVGGYASITGTLPASLIALFGNPQALTAVNTNSLHGLIIPTSAPNFFKGVYQDLITPGNP